MSESLMSKAPSDVRVGNISAIFNLIFPDKQIPRVELGNRIGLSRMATSGVTGEMIQNHILREVGNDTRQGRGKRSKVLAIDTAYWRIVTLDLSDEFLFKGALTNLCGSIIHRIEMPSGNSEDEKITNILSLCKALINYSDLPVLGIGIALTGIVNAEGTVVYSVRLGWKNFPIRSIVEEATGIPAIIGNDTNVSLVAERYFGKASANSMFITLSGGIGASLYINGSVVQGDTFAAGEIGHIVVDPQGQMCNCGRRGCLESILAEPVLRSRIERDPDHRNAILTQAGHRLGVIMSVPVGLLNLREVAIYGASDIVTHDFVQGMQEELDNNILSSYGFRPIAYRSSQGEDLVLRGQAVEVIRNLVPNIHGSQADNTK